MLPAETFESSKHILTLSLAKQQREKAEAVLKNYELVFFEDILHY
jgi:hypothetical protein